MLKVECDPLLHNIQCRSQGVKYEEALRLRGPMLTIFIQLSPVQVFELY
jgi:hypothetical protein